MLVSELRPPGGRQSEEGCELQVFLPNSQILITNRPFNQSTIQLALRPANFAFILPLA